MRPTDLVAGEPREPSLFEQWMGITPDEWNALGAGDNADQDDTAPVEQPS